MGSVIEKYISRKTTSPLRYPGGKGLLSGFVEKMIDLEDESIKSYCEPFSGGAGIALDLLLKGKVERVIINDLDTAVFSFWDSVFNQTDLLICAINEFQFNIEEWKKRRKIYQTLRKKRDTSVELAAAFFYLNRTNRSGILNAGVIGGMSQSGTYRMDARFNRSDLVEKIENISEYREKVIIENRDGIEVAEENLNNAQTLIYLDPPYYEKGGSLYYNSMNEESHKRLRDLMAKYLSSRWLLSYDNVKDVQSLYKNFFSVEFSFRYSATGSKEGKELMIFSDLEKENYNLLNVDYK